MEFESLIKLPGECGAGLHNWWRNVIIADEGVILASPADEKTAETCSVCFRNPQGLLFEPMVREYRRLRSYSLQAASKSN